MDGRKDNPMSELRAAVMWAAMTLIILLIFLSIFGAFLGAERAEEFFNRLPLAVYWTALALLLMVAIAVFRRLLRVPGLLLMHAGCVMVLVGGMWGSRAGDALQKRLFGIDKIRSGQMAIYEGSSQNRVALGTAEQLQKLVFSSDQQGRIEYYYQDGDNFVRLEHKELPFSIRLKDFRLEYYEPVYLHIRTRGGEGWKIPVEIGAEFLLGDEFGTVKIVKAYENFKIAVEDGKNVPYEDPQPGFNPALEVQITEPDGDVTTEYVFELFPGHGHPEDRFLLSYHRVIRDYVSELEIIRDNRIVAEKDIEVNHPLGFGGHHFYQHSYDDRAGQYTVLTVFSNTGLPLVYAGYWMLCVGVIWHLWLRHVLAKIRSKSR